MINKANTKAIKWARKRLPVLAKQMGIFRSAVNQLISEAEREFNIVAARAIEKALKVRRNPETEEEIAAWEAGL